MKLISQEKKLLQNASHKHSLAMIDKSCFVSCSDVRREIEARLQMDYVSVLDISWICESEIISKGKKTCPHCFNVSSGISYANRWITDSHFGMDSILHSITIRIKRKLHDFNEKWYVFAARHGSPDIMCHLSLLMPVRN